MSVNRIIAGVHGNLKAVPKLRRQYGVADYTPTIAVYKPLRARPIRPAFPIEWVRYYASVGSDIEFLMAVAAFLLDAAPW